MINGNWIGRAPGELSIWKTEPITDEREEELKQTANVERGSFLLRKSFQVHKPISSATLNICGLGFYEVYINGRKPDPARVLTPLVSDYYKLIKYDTYEVAALLSEGRCSISAEIGPGWFSGNPKYWGWQQTWYGNPRLIASLEITYADGSTDRIESGPDWKIHRGGVVNSCIYDGEEYDFALEQSGWTSPAFDDSGWDNAMLVEAPSDNLMPSSSPPVRIIRTLEPVAVSKLSETETLYDFGENAAAMPLVTVRGQAGATVTLHHAEFLTEDGKLDPTSENRALCTDVYHLSDSQIRECGPRFTWHGYRYMTVTVSSPDIEIIRAVSRVIHSDVQPTGSFECSREDINSLHAMYVRTQLADLQGVPVDCPQRDERKAWLGDAHVTSEMCLYNFDMHAFYSDWLEDIRVGVHPENKTVPFICPRFGHGNTSIDWNVAYPVILSEMYDRYADIELLRRHYPTLKAHTEYYISTAVDGIIPPCWFGDWFTLDFPDGTAKVAFACGEDNHRQNPPFAATLFYCRTLRLSARIAELTGHSEDAAEFERQRKLAVSSLYARHYNRETGDFGAGGQFLQTAALFEHIVPEEESQKAFDRLVAAFEATDMHPIFGVIGTRMIADVMYERGRPDLLWKIITAEGYPGPLHMLTNGRTTLTEGLDGTGSGCHNMFASPDTVFYRMLGGITVNRSESPSITIQPYCPQDLDWVSCKQALPEGEVRVRWERKDGKIKYEIHVPKQLNARVILGNGLMKLEDYTGSDEFILEDN